MHSLKYVALTFVVLLGGMGCRQKGRVPVLLRLQYQKGDVFDIRYQTYATSDDKGEPLKNEYIRMTYKVDSVYRNGQYGLSAKFVYVRADNTWPIPEQYSSDKEEYKMGPTELAIHSKFKLIRDSVFTMIIDNMGRLVKPLSFANGSPVPKQFNPIDYEYCQVVFPKDSVVTGGDWNNETIDPVTKNKRIYTYTLYSIKEAVMEIGVKCEFEGAASGETHYFTGEYIVDKDDQNLKSGQLEMEETTDDMGKVKIGVVINGPR